MSFDTETNQLMAQIDVLKKENELLRASRPPNQELCEPVYQIGCDGDWFDTDKTTYKGHNGSNKRTLFNHAPNSQAIIEKLEAEKAELLEVLKDTANKIYSNSTIDELIARMESKP